MEGWRRRNRRRRLWGRRGHGETVTALHCAMDTNAHPSFMLEEGRKASRKLSLFAHEIEAVHKHTQTQNRAKLFLHCVVYEETSSLGSTKKKWISAETSDGIKFEISLCTETPLGLSRLFLKTDDAVSDSPTSTLSFLNEKKRMTTEALASCYNAILLHTIVHTRIYPYFHDDYYLLKNDVPSPVIFRLPEMPCVPGINFGLLHQEGGHYTVAWLKKDMPSTTAMGSSTLSGYKTSEVTEGPFVCTFSTSTNEWTSRPVSLPDHLTSWDWDTHTVLANDNSFWWVDFCCGILSYDVHQQQPALGFIPLPSSCIHDGEIESDIKEDRCVSISTGELRCVRIFRKNDLFFDYGIKSQQCEDYVKTWSWRDGKWVENREMKFADFWEGTSYSSSGLPKFVPAYPTVDPSHPNLIEYRGEVCPGLIDVGGVEIFEFSEAGAKEDQQQESGEMAVSDIFPAPTKRRRLGT